MSFLFFLFHRNLKLSTLLWNNGKIRVTNWYVFVTCYMEKRNRITTYRSSTWCLQPYKELAFRWCVVANCLSSPYLFSAFFKIQWLFINPNAAFWQILPTQRHNNPNIFSNFNWNKIKFSEEEIQMMAIIVVYFEIDFIVLYYTQLDSKAEWTKGKSFSKI